MKANTARGQREANMLLHVSLLSILLLYALPRMLPLALSLLLLLLLLLLVCVLMVLLGCRQPR
jgi:hypothetical protein